MARIVKIMAVMVLLALCGSAWALDANDPNLVAHWKFDEGSGSTAYDSAGSNDGTLVNGPIWTSGQIDGGLEFDGINDSVDVGDPPDGSLDFGTADFTLSVWFKTSAAPGFFVCKRAKGYYAGYDFYIQHEGKIFARLADGYSVPDARTAAGFNDGLWHHVVAVYDRDGVIRIYVDGVSKATSGSIGGIGSVNNSEPFTIGDRNDPGHHSYFEGNLDDVRVYNRALSAEEVREVYLLGLPAHERAIAKLEYAVNEKKQMLDGIEETLGDEQDAYEALEEMLESKDYSELNKRDIIRARQEIHSAMQRQEQAAGALEGSIEGLYDALTALGWEPEPEPNEPNLIAHWKLDEDSGSTAYDSAGNNDGTVVGASWTTGQINGALSFDGVNDYVDCGNDNSLKPPLPVTLSAWIKMENTGTNQWIIGLDDRSSIYYGIWFYVADYSKLNLGYGDGGPKDKWHRRSKVGTTELSPDIWYHVVAVINGPTDISLYINGIDDGGAYSGTGGNLAYSGSGNSFIGSNSNVESYFDGTIDDVRIYDRALTASEILQLFQDGLN